MNLAIVTRMPDEDSGPIKPRAKDGAVSTEAFEGELRGAEGRARKTAAGSVDAAGRTPDDTGEDAPAVPGERVNAGEGAMARDVLGLLAAVSDAPASTARENGSLSSAGAGPGAPLAGSGPARTDASDRLLQALANTTVPPRATGEPDAPQITADLDGPPAQAPEADGDRPGPPRSRLVVARQETHFEPALGHAVLVEGNEAAAVDKVTAQGADLVRLLAARTDGSVERAASARAVAPAGEAGDQTAVAPKAGESAPSALVVGAQPAPRTAQDSGRAVGRSSASADPMLPARAVEISETSSEDDARRTAPSSNEAGPDGQPGAVPETPAGRRPVRSNDAPAATRAGAVEARSGRAVPDGERFVAPLAATSSMPSPQTLPSMTVQVAERVIDAFGGPSAHRPVDEAPASAHLRLRAGGAAMRTLTIQLQPENLGLLHVSMRLRDGQLMLEISADKAETARMLTEDRTSLRTLLEKAGFALDDASIVVAVRDTAPAAAASTAAREGAASPEGRGADRGPGSFGGDGGDGDQRGPQGGATDEGAGPAGRVDDAGGRRGRPGGSTFL